MHGNRPNPEFFSGIPLSANRYPIAMPIMGYRTVSTNPCGEIPLVPLRLLPAFGHQPLWLCENPFTADAKFDFELFKKHVHIAQRMMDDIIDLELEKIDAILEKINKDPEDPEVKRVERKLWENIRVKAEEGRRTGIGITAEGDMLAALGLRYGSDDAIDFSVEVHKTLAIEAYRSSVEVAKERGAICHLRCPSRKGQSFYHAPESRR